MLRLLTCLLLLCGGAHAADDAVLDDKARAIAGKVLNIDMHVDIFVRQGERTTAGYAQALGDAFGQFAAIHKLAEETSPDKIDIALTAADARRIKASGRKVAFIGVESAYPMGTDLRLLDQFYDYGARCMSLVHNGHSATGDSAQPKKNEPPAEWNGLSPLGKQAVRRMNALGIIVDVSHASEKTALDMIAASKAPVLASHSNVAAVTPGPRNLSDAVLAGIAKTGGVAQIVALDDYVHTVAPEKTAAIAALAKDMGLEIGVFGPRDTDKLPPEKLAAYNARTAEINKTWPRANVRDLVDHVDYAVKKIGIDHVGISSSFNGGAGIDGWEKAEDLSGVTRELVRRGYTEAQIDNLWSGNFLRVLDDVQNAAVGLQKRAR